MAIYHLQAKVIQRSKGRSVIAAAAYRAAEALHDAELGRTQNFLAKTGVIHSEILLPDGAPARWLDRETLWNEVTSVERRHDAVLAREIEIALPRELSQAEAIRLARDFVGEQLVARGMVADLSVHWGRAGDGEAQPHAHVLLTLRRIVPGPAGHPEDGAFGFKERAWNDKALLLTWRTRWAEMANARLAELGHDLRIDHRSNAARGIDLAPSNKIGPAGARRAARGEDAERADEHRAIARRNGERLLAEPELALRALTHQQSTFTRHDLARLIDRQTDGAEQFAAVMARAEASPELVRVGRDGRGRDRFSTREMVAIERQLVATAVALTRRTTHRVNDTRRIGVVNGEQGQLSEEQVLAYLHVTRSRDLAVVVGIAGGGKSTMLGTARQVWEGQGYRVRGAALSGIAAEGLQGSAGIESRTIASWEHAWNQDRDVLTARDVLVLDEAGMVGSRQLGRLLERVHTAGAKLVLVGDAEQLQAIEAGAAFRAIAERVGAIAITEPRRQTVDWQRTATKELATARTEAALDRYAAAGLVHRHATREAARAGVIAAWDAARRENPGHSQIILAHERVDVRALNDAAREVRKVAGELGPDQVLRTEAGPLAFAEGDRIYFLRNERGLGGSSGTGVKNGTLGTLTRIEGERLTVRLDGPEGAGTGRAVTFDLADYADIGHGYAATIHRNQGATVDQAHVLATPGMDRHLAYVAMSRHRHAARLHWSEADFGTAARLRDRLGRERTKDTTLDHAEPDADPIVAYAERRGLTPRAPVSEIVARPDPAPPAPAPDPVPLAPARDARPPAIDPAPRVAPAGGGRSPLDTILEALRGIAPQSPGPEPAPAPEMFTPMAERFAAFEARLTREHARKRLEPMLPAVPYRPMTEKDVAAIAGELETPKERLRPLLAQAYRDSATAWARLEALLRASATEDEVAAILTRQGPAALGGLRGGAGIFASETARNERWLAEHAARRIPEELLSHRRHRSERAETLRLRLGADRRRETIAVPGLTAAALAAIARLEQAGADKPPIANDTAEGRYAAAEIALAARVAPVWAAIQADPLLRDELAAFRKAAEARLGDYPDLLAHPGVFRFHELLQVLTRAGHLAERHASVEAARIAREQAEAEHRDAAWAAAEARRRAVAKARLERKPRAPQSDTPRPRPSSGPSIG
jgi:Ti-type conjugative transfer relaxase TraA